MDSMNLPGRWGEGSSERPSAEETAFYRTLVDNLYDGVYFVNGERTITYWNKGAERLTGYTREEVAGRRCFDNILEHIDETGRCLCVEGCPLKGTIEDGIVRETEVYLKHKLGHRVPVSVRSAPIRNSIGQIVGAVEVFSDVSAKKHVERRAMELEGLAYLDPLTGLANRRYTELRLQQMIQDVRLFDRVVGVLLIDVDRFKHVNDTWGHMTGDLVLRAVSKTLERNIRNCDVAGRWGGDEFLILFLDADLLLLRDIAERCRMLAGATSIDVHSQVRVTIALGATLLRAEDSSESAVHRADQLMYRSKDFGGNRVTLG